MSRCVRRIRQLCAVPQQSDTQSPDGSAGGDSEVFPSKLANQPRILKVAGVAESHPGTFLLHVHAPDVWQRAFTLKILVTEATTVQAVKEVIEKEEQIGVKYQRLRRLVQDPSCPSYLDNVAESSYLEDVDLLSAHGVTKDSIIQLCYRLPTLSMDGYPGLIFPKPYEDTISDGRVDGNRLYIVDPVPTTPRPGAQDLKEASPKEASSSNLPYHPNAFLLHVQAPNVWCEPCTLKIWVAEDISVKQVKEKITESERHLSVSYQRLSCRRHDNRKGLSLGAQMFNHMLLRTCGLHMGSVITLELRFPYNCKTGFRGLLSTTSSSSESEANVAKQRRLSKTQAQ